MTISLRALTPQATCTGDIPDTAKATQGPMASISKLHPGGDEGRRRGAVENLDNH